MWLENGEISVIFDELTIDAHDLIRSFDPGLIEIGPDELSD
jgi:hypothetical protein